MTSFLVPCSSFLVKELLACILSAVLLILPFANSALWLFAWFGFVPLFFAIENKSKGRAFFLSYLTGLIFWLGTIYWLVHVTLLGLILLSLYLALYFGLFGILISSYALSPITYNLFAIPSLWVALEYLRGHLLTGFPWALLGYSQYQNLPIIQIADITGAYGVSFLLMMGNTVIYKVIGNRLWVEGKKNKIAILLSSMLLVLTLSYGYSHLNLLPTTYNLSPIRISLIQANIPQELKWSPAAKEDIVNKYFRLTREILQARPDLIIWPETAMQDYLIIDKQGYSNIDYLSNFVRELKVPFLLGVVAVENEDFYNSAVLFSKEGGILQRYDKLHLVPFGEYIPLRAVLPFLEAVVPIGDFTAGREYTIFKSPVTRPTPNRGCPESPVKFSVLICFEDVFGELARNFVKKGADFLVNITNDAWFGDTSEPYQHLSASVFRAVENRVSVLRAANTGVSCFISPQGKIKTCVADKKGKQTFIDGHITGNIFIAKVRSIYNKYGDVFVLACFIVVGCGIITKLCSTLSS
ncbi:MAG: apolipoprotein N-acyltransferase [Candidatus Omnitrophota bacterium]